MLNRPRSPLTVNPNADVFLHPPGIEVNETGLSRDSTLPALRPNLIPDHGVYPLGMRSASHGTLVVSPLPTSDRSKQDPTPTRPHHLIMIGYLILFPLFPMQITLFTPPVEVIVAGLCPGVSKKMACNGSVV